MTADARPVVKRTARAILLDDDEMILIKRTKPGREPYWITPGGGVETGDATVVDALHRELDEELGAKVTDVVPAFVDTVPYDPAEDAGSGTAVVAPRAPEGADAAEGAAGDAVKVQFFFVCRLASMDLSRRHGPEVEEPRGEYEVVRVPFTRAGIASVEVVPPSLRAYLDANIEGVRALLGPDLG
ncbi:NUDIX domain-containing protein [Streptomyces pini]|uniref:ADP-ribose pyrophosphatase YjhB, NUDIX family n=1 Tax=Streptomyces pini TaxID=1520580 RepID=A0A1I4JBZ1_9ACTN|nr:NUDIX domain-containing protein [Streptomyces pini]SFL63713.1 ADP-ribose pyrophosphatase YjhB, NUDIX family [Streptomyces pini]